MKKILSVVIMFILMVGCTTTNTAKDVVEDYLTSYQNLEYQVLVDMEEVINSESTMTDDQKELYREILKKQYEDFSFEILSEEYNDDEAIVSVKITVYDYYEASVNASEYLKNNSTEFYDENSEYSSTLYMDYKLNLYQITTNRIDYTVDFELIKEDGIWKLNVVSNDVLEKIHGIYNYEN